MTEFMVTGIIEGVWLSLAWPYMMRRREGLHNPSVLRGNAHLEKCHFAWRWTTPITFCTLFILSAIGLNDKISEFDNGLVLSLSVFAMAIVIGSILGEFLGKYYKRHPQRHRPRRKPGKIIA